MITNIMENTEAYCNNAATKPSIISKLPSFTAISSCIIDHIIGTESLSPNEKLYYLVNDFYQQSFKSWKKIGNKTSIASSYSNFEVKFSANKIGNLLKFSKSKIFNIQAKLESLDCLQIKRTFNKFGMNNVNVPVITLPKNIFSQLTSHHSDKYLSNLTNIEDTSIEDILPEQRRDIISQKKQFIPLNFDLVRFVFFHNKLSCNSKLLYLKLFSIIHKIKQKNHFNIYAGGIETKTLLDQCNISRSTLLRCLRQLKTSGLIESEKIRVEEKAHYSNRFDKIINFIQLLVPSELNSVFPKKIQSNEDILNQNTASKQDPDCVKIIPSYTYSLKKKTINKTRSIKSNFVKINLEEEIEEKISQKSESLKSSEENNFFNNPKKISEFYPLSEEDGKTLQSTSGRNFNLNAMNEILKSLANKLQSHLFNSKKGFMNYMSKIYKYEMRDAFKISNETFKIRANDSKEDIIEKYLTEIENTRLISKEWYLKKKLASVLKPSTAYNLLKNYQDLEINNEKVTINLRSNIDLTELEQDIILSQVKATHEQIGQGGEYTLIENLVFSMPTLTMPAFVMPDENIVDRKNKNNISPRMGLWGNIRSKIVELLGPNGDAIDVSWFSKISAEIDEKNGQIKLKAPSDFVRDYIFSNYETIIEKGTKINGLKFNGIYSAVNPETILNIWR